MGKEADALATQAAPSFEDITIDYYKPFLAFAEANKWVEGKAEKKFGFNDVVTVKEFTAMLLRALGHDTMGENYAKVMDLAKEQGLFQGVMAEEAAPVIRGVAFIMMNNTLETAPKGEKQALVYKLGYKEMPKPENLTVVSAEAAGLKAIDVKFSKAVSEKTLNKILIKDNKTKISHEDPFLLDEMTARIVLKTPAKQDAEYSITVSDVKTTDMMETVEKFEGKFFMTDAVRPEVLSVEALNPKTLLVKVSEPINLVNKSFVTLKELKIEGKALVGRVNNVFKNELTFELYTALKAGDHKLEISGLKDFAGFIAKTMEFDITVVEDKEAPVVTEVTMDTLTSLKVKFNEPVANKGQFKVDTVVVPNANVTLNDDKMGATLTIPALGMAALAEVKVEYKGQKDIMGNMVKDWTAITIKVDDDTVIPEVKSVEADGKDLVITFSKKISEGSYSIMKGKNTIKALTAFVPADFDKDDKAIIKLKNVLPEENATEYTLNLKAVKDATIRKNELAKAEVTFSAGDTKAPSVVGGFAAENWNSNKQFLMIKIFFSEEMDEATLLDAKNLIFKNYKVDGETAVPSLRADAAKVKLSSEDGGKILVIEADDEKLMTIDSVDLVGLKDKAGNPLGLQSVSKNTKAQKIEKVEFIRTADKFQLKVVFANQIPDMGGAYKLIVPTLGNKDLNLRVDRPSDDRKTYFFDFDQDNIAGNGKYKKDATNYEALELGLVAADAAKDIYGQNATLDITAPADMAPAAIALNNENNPDVSISDSKVIKVTFDEPISNTAADHEVKVLNKDGIVIAIKALEFENSDRTLVVKRIGDLAFPNGTNKLVLTNIKDASTAKNVSTALGTHDVAVDNGMAKFDKVEANPAASQTSVKVVFTKEIKAADLAQGNYEIKWGTDANADAATTLALTSPSTIEGVGKNELKLNFGSIDLSTMKKIVITFKSEAGVQDAANGGEILVGPFTQTF